MKILKNLFGNKLGDVKHLIKKALHHRDWQVRFDAAAQLQTLKSTESVEYLMVALKDNDSAVRNLAASSLGGIGDPRAVESLRAALKDGDDELRKFAGESLAKFGIIVPSDTTSIREKKVEIKCSVCNRTNVEYLRDLKRKDPNIYIISQRFIGTCPQCNKAYCVEHAAYDGTIDHEVCPIHIEKLIVE